MPYEGYREYKRKGLTKAQRIQKLYECLTTPQEGQPPISERDADKLFEAGVKVMNQRWSDKGK